MIADASTPIELDTELSRACDDAWTTARRFAKAQPDAERLSVVVPLSHADVASMVRETSLGDLWVWDARDLGDPFATASRGVAAELDAAPGVERDVDALLRAIVEVRLRGAVAPPPRVLCALPFDADDTRGSAWGPLARGVVTLPRWTLSDDGARRALRLTVSLSELSRPAPRPAASSRARAPQVTRRRDFDDAYVDRVTQALSALGQDVTKLVAARAIELELDRPCPIEHAVLSLAKAHGLARFGLERGGFGFVGATPERLVRRTGAKIDSEALAGTRRANSAGATLSGSEKDRREQEIVRDAIVGTFTALGADVAPCDTATERAAGNVVHLTTKVSATMRVPPSALALARALSPTPAVSGFPRERAMSWLRAHEPPRGLYAGPVGWVEPGGDGHFVVGIRSALLTDSAAHAYVGAGIVRGSNPDAELEETRWKAETLLSALGMAR